MEPTQVAPPQNWSPSSPSVKPVSVEFFGQYPIPQSPSCQSSSPVQLAAPLSSTITYFGNHIPKLWSDTPDISRVFYWFHLSAISNFRKIGKWEKHWESFKPIFLGTPDLHSIIPFRMISTRVIWTTSGCSCFSRLRLRQVH